MEKTNSISKKIRFLKELFIILILLFFYTLISAFSYANYISQDISQGVFRLHVIANSDSKEDQDLKYLVRDNILKYMNSLCTDISSKEEAINIANANLDKLKQIAQDTVYDEGYDYPVNVSIGNFSFPTKYYGDISLPAGYYDALRIEIGNAAGQNWWCVMFPTLCFIDVTNSTVPKESKENLQENMSDESFSIISKNNDAGIHFKFKLIELFANF